MFQISYAIFVLVVGGLTGLALSASSKSREAKRVQFVLIGVAALVLLGFFARFGFFWGVITIAELVAGIIVGLRLGSEKPNESQAISPAQPAMLSPPIPDRPAPQVATQSPDEASLESALGWLILIVTVVVGVWLVVLLLLQGREFPAVEISASEAVVASEGLVDSEPRSQIATAMNPLPMHVAKPIFEVEPVQLEVEIRVDAVGARYRAEPFATPHTQILSTASKGDILKVTGQSIQNDGIWYQVELGDRRIAYIRSDLTAFETPSEPVADDLNLDSGVY